MKKIYATILYVVLGIEVLLFAGLYIRGPQGIVKLHEIHGEEVTICTGVDQLRQEVVTLKQDIEAWHKHPFHKEKIAREQLQMARPDDEVFYLT